MENFFLTHGWESGYRLWGISGHVACVRFQFLFCHLPLPDVGLVLSIFSLFVSLVCCVLIFF